MKKSLLFLSLLLVMLLALVSCGGLLESKPEVSGVTPQNLADAQLCWGCTTAQTEQQVQQYDGSYIEWSGKVLDVRTNGTVRVHVANKLTVTLYSVGSTSINAYEIITFRGTLSLPDRYTIDIHDAEIIK